VIGEVERLLDKGVEIDLAALARHPTRVVQHAPDDAVGAPAVLGDLFEIAGQRCDDFVDIATLVVGQPGNRRCRGLLCLAGRPFEQRYAAPAHPFCDRVAEELHDPRQVDLDAHGVV
jgi:hypothetical protein